HHPSATRPSQERLKSFPCMSTKLEPEGDVEGGAQGSPQVSTLLVNTTEILYKKSVFLDQLAGAVTKTRVMLGAEMEEKLFSVPCPSIREQLEQQGPVPENYYTPDLGQVPKVNVPSYLLDLPGDNVMYGASLGPSITHSAPGNRLNPLKPSEDGTLTAPQSPQAAAVLVSAPSSPPQALATAVQGARQNDSSSIPFRNAHLYGRGSLDKSGPGALILKPKRKEGLINKNTTGAGTRSWGLNVTEPHTPLCDLPVAVRAISQSRELMWDLNKLVLRCKAFSPLGLVRGWEERAPMSDDKPSLPTPSSQTEEEEDNWKS
uniref:WASH1 WAHD domain-containing protein n=1 Tax=Chlorocebus sabaeus TaxID=60711 RepID=A0A0D9RAM6_CHLSB